MIKRLSLVIQGAVQGVGFRPFIFRLASEMDLKGWIINSSQGVFIEVEGTDVILNRFISRIREEKPGPSFIQSLESKYLDPVGFKAFEIKKSEDKGVKTVIVLPDIATCPDCLNEVFDPKNRRYLYPFTNCTNCGPRYSIIESLPYDRPNTAMKHFSMCEKCQKEYDNPLDRRFHAQPNACPDCGPRVQLWDNKGKVLTEKEEALEMVVQRINNGEVIAIKGLGGFHLVVNAQDIKAVSKLRRRKNRDEKPFALMFPNIESIKFECKVSQNEEQLIHSSESPIVILDKLSSGQSNLAENVAPGNPSLGVMLPYTPLHYVLMQLLGKPIVATSGNLSDEPICIDEIEALDRLKHITDCFLVHNRPIVRQVDDSLVRIVKNRELVLRRSRGYAPLPVMLKTRAVSMLAVGAHQKNCVALNIENRVFISQHIGDLETEEAFNAFEKTISSIKNLYDADIKQIICDAHPEYLSSKYTKDIDTPNIEVQHHFAHMASCIAENEIEGPVLGIIWDGTGYGVDGKIWGGEFIHFSKKRFKRVGSLKNFLLPGGNQAVKEPRRTAVGLLFEMYGKEFTDRQDLKPVTAFQSNELKIILQMLDKNLNAPQTSSMGRLFDGVASILGLKQEISFEGQAAIELEYLAWESKTEVSYQVIVVDNLVQWQDCIFEIIKELNQGQSISLIAHKFHNYLVDIIIYFAKHFGEQKVVLSGGCFQNRLLTEKAIDALEKNGFQPYWHQRIPPNDGGIALGQIFIASLKH
ncbi:MAG: carbamoyltransferase HypF [Deltaproteobacteria bacterium]|jgi:hydrogenase maturation protein HypF|nr:carbamoyltransferase HypF [Deltaproteobacteria bacterium]MBT4525843.1 carbamoyltransferase HypF [Deltaproteobacteria bacterium]